MGCDRSGDKEGLLEQKGSPFSRNRKYQPGRAPKVSTKLWPTPPAQSPAVSFVALPGIWKDNELTYGQVKLGKQ